MQFSSLRRWLYFTLVDLRGQPLRANYARYVREGAQGIPPGTSAQLLARLLAHCRQSVPYYARVMQQTPGSWQDDPVAYLEQLPILTKEIIRNSFDELHVSDLAQRHAYRNTSGGSTGEPVVLLQDRAFAAEAGAVTLYFSKLAGREIGELEVTLWGSERDILQGSQDWRGRLINKLTNTIFLNAYRMSVEQMRRCIDVLNTRRPKLIVAYAQSIYELAQFAQRAGLPVVPQQAIITSATTLYPFMREQIESVFQCRVFNRYGSREVGDIACERPGCEGLWVAPWGNYIEIVDEAGKRVPDGAPGQILVTSLTNYAMPFVRYRIGDIGALAPGADRGGCAGGQVLQSLVGRSEETFHKLDGTLICPGYFSGLLYFKEWIRQFQVIQRSESHITFRIISSGGKAPPADLDEITANTRFVMGEGCKVSFEFVNEIAPSPSGKYFYELCQWPPEAEQPILSSQS